MPEGVKECLIGERDVLLRKLKAGGVDAIALAIAMSLAVWRLYATGYGLRE